MSFAKPSETTLRLMGVEIIGDLWRQGGGLAAINAGKDLDVRVGDWLVDGDAVVRQSHGRGQSQFPGERTHQPWHPHLCSGRGHRRRSHLGRTRTGKSLDSHSPRIRQKKDPQKTARKVRISLPFPRRTFFIGQSSKTPAPPNAEAGYSSRPRVATSHDIITCSSSSHTRPLEPTFSLKETDSTSSKTKSET